MEIRRGIECPFLLFKDIHAIIAWENGSGMMDIQRDDAPNTTSRSKHITKRKSKAARVVYDWMEDLVMAIVLVAVVFTFFVRAITVDGSSMNPNYYDGDRLLVSGQVFNVKQGDVVIVNNVNTVTGPIIKRVIATEGQTVDFDNDNGHILIDGASVDDSQYGLENGITKISWSNYQALDFPAVVPEGCVFVLGDNRELSKDSRYADVGMIDIRNILGKALLKIYPLNDFGKAK